MSTSEHTANPSEAETRGVDLQQLAFQRQTPSAAASISTRRHWLTRYVLPGTILLGFAGLFAWAAQDALLPAHAVTVTPVIVTRAEMRQEGTPLFQAAGWIEPRPTSVVVTALAPGVVKDLFVVEGQRVKQGEPLAKLIEIDAKLSLQQAQAALRLCDADVQNAHAALTAAQTTLANPNELEAALADAESMLAETKLSLGNLPFMIEAAQSRKQLAVENVARKERAGDAIAGRMLLEAKAELTAAASALAELEARGPTLTTQAESLERKRAALGEQLQLMTEQKRAVAAAESALAAAKARRDQAQLTVDAATINLDRMTIRAPLDGRVLTLDARPGTRIAGLDSSSQYSSTAVVTLYDPKSLQVRVDVRLEDVPQVRIGQPCTIETAALATPVSGEVSWVTTRADIQKNTLQVKVAIHDPPEVITPEMLGQVTFLAPPQPEKMTGDANEPLRMFVPRSLVVSGDGGATIWVVHPVRGTASRQSIELGRAGADQLVEVTQGIDPTDKLIVDGREALTEGARIRITGEDQSAGHSSAIGIGGSSSIAAPTTNVQIN